MIKTEKKRMKNAMKIIRRIKKRCRDKKVDYYNLENLFKNLTNDLSETKYKDDLTQGKLEEIFNFIIDILKE